MARRGHRKGVGRGKGTSTAGKAPPPNHRRRAHRLLTAIEHGAYASELFEPDDPPFVRELVLGVCRRKLTLDAIHAAFAKRELDSLDLEVRIAVRIGLYQMMFMDAVPAHAAVSESVSTVRLRSQRTYVNGVLRTIDRESNRVPVQRDRGGASPRKRLERPGRTVAFFSRAVFPDPETDRVGYLAALHSHPEFLVRRWIDAVGEDQAVAWMIADNQPPPLVLRPRRGRVTAEDLAKRLVDLGVTAGVIDGPDGPLVEVPRGGKVDRVMKSDVFAKGLCSVQSVEQSAPVAELAPQPGEIVWDVCAAPGGKTTQIAEHLEGSGGRVVATDVDAARLERVTQNVERLGLTDVVTVAVHEALSDDPPPGMPEGGFDAILLDAPCSNTAVLAARPEARWRVTEDAIGELAAMQKRLVEAVKRRLKAGGRFVYSTCSREPEERATARVE